MFFIASAILISSVKSFSISRPFQHSFIRSMSVVSTASSSSTHNLLSCQIDSYANEGESKVVSYTKLSDKAQIILDDSVLYPEGGGQPWDLGTVQGVNIERVTKCQGSNKHILVELQQPLELDVEAGDFVHCSVDWTRRYDFMQQHTAQVFVQYWSI
jgi:alanyl-tRNA synthetase